MKDQMEHFQTVWKNPLASIMGKAHHFHKPIGQLFSFLLPHCPEQTGRMEQLRVDCLYPALLHQQ